MTANYHLKAWAAAKKLLFLLLLFFPNPSEMVAHLCWAFFFEVNAFDLAIWWEMRDHRWRSYPVSHKGKRCAALIEATGRLSVLSCSVRRLPAPLRTSVFEGSANEYRRAIGVKRRLVWRRNCCCCPNVCHHARSQVVKDEVRVSTWPPFIQPHPKPSLLAVNQRIGGLLGVPVALAEGRSVASSQTCPNEYLILTWLPIASVQYSMHNGAPCGLARCVHTTQPASSPEEPSLTCAWEACEGGGGDSSSMDPPPPPASFSSALVLLSARFHLPNWSSILTSELKAAAWWEGLLRKLGKAVENG